LFIFAVLFIIVLAVYELQKWLDSIQISSLVALGSLLLLGFELNDLWQNFQFWAVGYAVTTFQDPSTFEQGHWVVTNHSDPHYIRMLAGGLGVTCLTLVALAFLVRKDKRRSAKASQINKSSEDLSIPI
jgi:4-amino-4-deoxy-L-arabinose transferase-like glycosyltransferase